MKCSSCSGPLQEAFLNISSATLEYHRGGAAGKGEHRGNESVTQTNDKIHSPLRDKHTDDLSYSHVLIFTVLF